MPTKDYSPIDGIIETILNDYGCPNNVFDPIEELLKAMKHGQEASLTTTITPKTCTCGGKCDHDRHTVNLVVDHFDEMATKIIEKAVDDRIGDTVFGIRTILANHNKNAFTVVWEDGESTVIHLQDGDEWDDEKALAMCFVKKLFGNKGSFNYIFTEELPKKLKTIPKKDDQKTSVKELPKEECPNMLKEATPDKTDSLQSRVNELLGESKKTEKTEKFYSVYAYNTYTKRRELLDGANPMTLRDAKKRVNMLQTVSGYPHVSRVWEANNELYIDYGSHVNYIVIPGLTAKEYLG
jgi:hypothetical protein